MKTFYVILEKSRLNPAGKVKVKVPIHFRRSGKVTMGYRYRLISKKIVKQKKKYVRDVPIYYGGDNEDLWIQDLRDQNKIEKNLVSPDSDLWGQGSEKLVKEGDKLRDKLETLNDKVYYYEGFTEDLRDRIREYKDKIRELKYEKVGSPEVRQRLIKKLKKQVIATREKLKIVRGKYKEFKALQRQTESEAERKERLSEKGEKAPLKHRIPSPEGLKIAGAKAIEKALKKVGLGKIKSPDDVEHLHPYAWSPSKPREWQDDWASSANDDGSALSDVLHYAMASKLPEGSYDVPPGLRELRRGMELVKKEITKKPIRKRSDIRGDDEMYKEKYEEELEEWEGMKEIEKMYGDYIKAANVVLNTIYQRTQRILRNMGYRKGDYIYLYRGMDVGGIKKGQVVDLKKFKHNPLSSWSTDPSVAEGFGKHIFVTKVKVKDIISVYLTGFGCQDESEVIIPAHAAAVAKVLR